MADVLLIEDKVDSIAEDLQSSDQTCTEGNEMTQKQEERETDSFACDSLDGSEDLLPPITRLEKYASSNVVFNREMVARNLLETLGVVADNADDVSRVVNILCNLAEDYEPTVRAELMQQIPHIAVFFNKYDYQLGYLIQQYIVPMIIKYLIDTSNQVRKTCQASILLMVEQGLIDQVELEKKICPRILQLTESSYMDDLRTEAVTLLSKLSPLLGKEITEQLFLQRYTTLCLDSSFHVRKVCADNFGEICTIMEKETTEKILLPKFYFLCEDSVWGVRKVCAEVFVPVSSVCSMDTRHKILTPVYMNLLRDQSRWVRMAAFQALGPFISTFAEPSKTGLYYSKECMLMMVDLPDQDSEESSTSPIAPTETKEEPNLEGSGNPNVNIPENSCDSIVPLSNSSENSNCIQSTTCHLGNYRTVIELSSPSCNSTKTTDTLATDNCDLEDADMKRVIYVEDGYKGDSGSHLTTDCGSEEPKKDPLREQETMLNGVEEVEKEYCNGDVSDHILLSDLHNYLEQNSDVSETKISKSSFSSIIVVGESVPKTVLVNGFADPSVVDPEDQLSLPPISISKVTIEGLEEPVEEVIDEDESLGCTTSEPSHVWEETNGDLAVISEAPDDPVELDGETDSSASSESAFNHFQYWRMPILTVDPDAILDEIQSAESNWGSLHKCNGSIRQRGPKACLISPYYVSSANISSESDDQSSTLSCDIQTNCEMSNLPNQENSKSSTYSTCNFCGSLQDDQSTDGLSDNYLKTNGMNQNSPGASIASDDSISSVLSRDHQLPDLGNTGEPPPVNNFPFDQDIVPPELLLRYLSMTHASRAQNVDAEIARHCAYSLPAVALTLGRKFWPCLRGTFNTLASEMQGFIMQWKVRRTLASSMHQLAVILGPEIAATDLLPIFSGFIKDLDEVRIGILQHLSDFLAILEMKDRKSCLNRFGEFLNTDNNKNWRFRHILAEQLIHIAELYEANDVVEYLLPLALALVQDKVSEVRLVAVRVVAVMVRRMKEEPSLPKEFLSELAELFIHSPKWHCRQIYVYLCQEFVRENSLPTDEFAEDALPHLLYLSWDRVANVRLAIARCLAQVIWPQKAFSGPDSPHRELLLHAIHPLQSDMDTDVRYFANMVSTQDCACLQHPALSDLDDQAV